MSLMLAESLEAPARVAELLRRDREAYAALGERLRSQPPPGVLTIARGSSDHAAAYGAYLLGLLTGQVAASLPPSLVSLEAAPLAFAGRLVLAVSQSGQSHDVLACAKAARAGGGTVAAIVNDAASPLAGAAGIVLGQHAGPERGIAATKSFIATLTIFARLAAAWSGEAGLAGALPALPDNLAAAAAAGQAARADWLEGAGHALVLARGLGLPIAQEIALKLKETCGFHAEAFSSAEVRHGPREIVDGRYVVLALALPGPGRDDVLLAAAELKRQGARVETVGAEDGLLPLPDGPDRRLAPILAAQALYPLIARTATALGRDPDRPRTLSKVTRTL